MEKTATNIIFGILGYPLTHSFSPEYFRQKFKEMNLQNHIYKKFEIKDIADVRKMLSREKGLTGFNVTIPHKKAILPFLDAQTPEAQKIGAVNTVRCDGDKWIGHNTDYIGFLESLKKVIQPEADYHAYILGSGGSSKAVVYALEVMQIPFHIVSRKMKNQQIDYARLNTIDFSRHLIFINTTPLGMYPEVSACPPIPYQKLNEQHILYDLIYNPAETLFLKKGKQQGCSIMNGLEMLHSQAEHSWKYWNNR